MKLSHIASAATLALGAMFAGQAYAADVCVNCQYTASGATNLGTLNPLINDSHGFRRTDLSNSTGVSVNVTDTWFFTLSPAGTAQITASFVPFSGTGLSISNLIVSLYNTNASFNVGLDCAGVAQANGTTGFCAGYSAIPDLGGLIVAGAPSFTLGFPSGSAIFPVALGAGTYAMLVNYDFASGAVGTSQYSGQIFTNQTVPEPGTLALAGLALVGVAAGLRRTRKA